MAKASSLLLCVCFFSGAICAEQTDSCAGLEASALTQCRGYQQTLLHQQQLEQQLRQQEERQNQLDRQQHEVQQQMESMRLQNEDLRKQLEHEMAAQAARPGAADSRDSSKSPELKRWKADNPWFGTDYVKTQFAMRYMKQLEHERPDLQGRELLDALSTKVNDTYGAKH
jgi:TolA-binding protein